MAEGALDIVGIAVCVVLLIECEGGFDRHYDRDMAMVSVQQAKTHLSSILDRVLA